MIDPAALAQAIDEAPAGDPGAVAQALASGLALPAGVRRRQAVVAAVNTDGTLDLHLGGDTSVVVPARRLDSYTGATVADTVWVLVEGPDLLVLGRVAREAPTHAFGLDQGQRSTSSTAYTHVATLAEIVRVGRSGVLRVSITVTSRTNAVGAFAYTSPHITNADTGAVYFEADDVRSAQAQGDRWITMTWAHPLTITEPGARVLVALRHRVSASTVTGDFVNRRLSLFPI
jgi:hypothetical protein